MVMYAKNCVFNEVSIFPGKIKKTEIEQKMASKLKVSWANYAENFGLVY
jgi:hypothetical protein